MALKLPQREMPVVTFKRALPAYLAGGDECHIEIDARPAGPVNPAYMAATEQVAVTARAKLRALGRVEDDLEYAKQDAEFARQIAAERFAAIYDACVIEWRSNILDDGKPIACTRENFLALVDIRIPEIAAAFLAFKDAVEKAAEDVAKETEATAKN